MAQSLLSIQRIIRRSLGADIVFGEAFLERPGFNRFPHGPLPDGIKPAGCVRLAGTSAKQVKSPDWPAHGLNAVND